MELRTASDNGKNSSNNNIQNLLEKRSVLPPWLFLHKELDGVLENSKKIKMENIINTINHIHFRDGQISLMLKNPLFGESILLKAHPEPCLNDELTCLWANGNALVHHFENLQLEQLVIDDGISIILSPAIVKEMDEHKIHVKLPEVSFLLSQRKIRRYICSGITAEISQNGLLAQGELIDFSPIGFRSKVETGSPNSFNWFNSEDFVSIQLKNKNNLIFSGSCRCIREVSNLNDMEIVLQPAVTKIQRFKKKQSRARRQKLIPSPNLVFFHPILKRRTELKCYDISSSGFSVTEEKDKSVLTPGMIIPELSIQFAGSFKLNCMAQVIYRHDLDDTDLICGLAILDMDINSYSRLTQILFSTSEPHAYISNEVDMDSLWEFFFETGFIYPKKYRLIQARKDRFKETYRKLYQESPEIAKHFTYQENGMVYGHISMIKAYERTWMMQHYAARNKDNKRTGFIVLKQLINYLNDLYRLPSAKMDYLLAYFRPENRFPDRVFGGFTRELNNPKGSSMDLFAYLPHTSLSIDSQLPKDWSLSESTPIDLWSLKRCYNHFSGGLLLDALGLDLEVSEADALKNVFKKFGFIRKWSVYSLKNKGLLNAVLIVNQSNLGINLSELLSGIKVIVTNPDELPWNILSIAISKLTGDYQMDKIPVLFTPFRFVEDNNIPYEKKYMIWVLNAQYGNEYMEYMHKRFRMNYDT